MVTRFVFWFSLFLSDLALSVPLNFRIQLSKPTFFQGEQITATFVVEAEREVVAEVEVVKFPEFRGFWSENILLRQGPIHFSPNAQFSRFIAVIGSYSLQSILNYEGSQVRPMKILVKGLGPDPQVLEAEGAPLHILPLPMIPPSLKEFPFSGAVGTFSLIVENTQIPYRKDQPFKLQAVLIGEGNFAELNSLPVSLPAELTVVSQTSHHDAFSGRNRKFFEWVLSSSSDALPNLKAGSFLFFDPTEKKYQLLSFPEISFVPLAEPVLPENLLRKQAIEFYPEPKWSNSAQSMSWNIFWILAIIGAAASFLWIASFQYRRFRELQAQDPKRWWNNQKKRIGKALREGDWSTFVPLAAQCARRYLAESERTPLTGQWGIQEALQTLIEADHQLRFSPQKTLTVAPEKLRECWNQVTNTGNAFPESIDK